MNVRAATVGLVVLLAGFACQRDKTQQLGDGAPSDAASDAGSDDRTSVANSKDAADERDTAEEREASTGSDSADGPEASADADYAYPGQWTTIPEPPEGCDVQISLTPAIAVPALEWKPCANGRTGCARHIAEWNPGAEDRTLSVSSWEDPFVVNGVPNFMLVRHYYHGERKNGYVVALQSLTGAAKYVIAVKQFERYSKHCGNNVGFGDDGVHQVVKYEVDEKTERTWFTFADWSDPFVTRNVQGLSQEWIGGPVTDLFPHQGRLFVTMLDHNYNPKTAVIDPEVPKVYWPNGQTSYPSTSEPKLVKDGVLLLAEAPADGIHVMTRDGAAQSVIATRPGYITTTFDVDHGAEDTIVWLEAKEDSMGNLGEFSLWASPYATSEAGVVRRQLAEAAEDLATNALVANAGAVVLTTTNRQEGRIIRLSDGASWKVPADPDMYFVHPLWIDDQAVWFLTQTNLTTVWSPTNGIIRIDRSTLGAPAIPTGN